MTRSTFPALMLLSASLLVAAAAATAAEVPRYTVDSGGVTSAGGTFEVTGTLGQPDAGEMSGGSFALSGGFWTRSNPFVPVELQSFEIVDTEPAYTPAAGAGPGEGPTVSTNRCEEASRAGISVRRPTEPKEEPTDDPEPSLARP